MTRVAADLRKTRHDRGVLPVIPVQDATDDFAGPLSARLLHDFGGVVAAPVVDHDEFEPAVAAVQSRKRTVDQLLQAPFFVVNGNNHRNEFDFI